jgi:hypothetical protein
MYDLSIWGDIYTWVGLLLYSCCDDRLFIFDNVQLDADTGYGYTTESLFAVCIYLRHKQKLLYHTRTA